MDLGRRIIELRKQKHISQEELASILNVSRQSISLWETNQSMPTTEKLMLLANYFEITLDALVGNKQEEHDANASLIATATIDINEDALKTFMHETWSHKENHAWLFVFIGYFMILFGLIYLFRYALEMVIVLSLLTVLIIPIMFLARKKGIQRIIKKSMIAFKDAKQTYYFYDDYLKITHDSPYRNGTSKVLYNMIDEVLISSQYMYVPVSPNIKDKYQVDISKLDKQTLNDIIKRLSEANVQIKMIGKQVNQTRKYPISYRKIFLFVWLANLVGIITIIIHNNIVMNEFASVYNDRTSILILRIHLIWLFVIILTIVYIVIMKRNKIKTKLFGWSYATMAILSFMVFVFSMIMPPVLEGMYEKDYDVVIDIFDHTNLYLPEGRVISNYAFNQTSEDFVDQLAFKISHEVVFTSDSDVLIFNQEVISLNMWVSELNIDMHLMLSDFLKRINADYYLIYNVTENNFNIYPTTAGLNRLYFMAYDTEESRLLIYEFYIRVD